MALKSKEQSGGGRTLYQLKITLMWCRPPIWRRVLVRANTTLERLHKVIQVAMGWSDTHLHQFIVPWADQPAFLRGLDEGPRSSSRQTLNEKHYTVADLAPTENRKFLYEYNFGDSWEHEVVAERVLPDDDKLLHPVCLAGANACPPEDCGGVGGFYDLLGSLADSCDRNRHGMKARLGSGFEPTKLDLDRVNSRLKRLRT